jgi:branched-subunit amino acid aminotransferase/4-amino-4-deoxychorismate lyase
MYNSRILDTLIFKDSQIFLRESHVERTFEAYGYLNLFVTRAEIEKVYLDIETKHRHQLTREQSLRILFSRKLPISYEVEIRELTPLQSTLKLQLHFLTEPQTEFFKFKWENRQYWQDLIKQKTHPSVDDLILVNPSHEVVETTRFNVFCYDETSLHVYTPTLTSGCLNGAFRRHVLINKRIELPEIGFRPVSEKKILSPELIGSKIFIANSVRGVIAAELYMIQS